MTPELAAAFWTAMAKPAKKEADARRDDLADGAKYEVRAQIRATVNGVPVHRSLVATLGVGHATRSTSTTAPKPAYLAALILGCLSDRMRNAVRKQLFQGDAAPAPSPEALGLAEALVTRFSARHDDEKRGAVTCSHAVEVGR